MPTVMAIRERFQNRLDRQATVLEETGSPSEKSSRPRRIQRWRLRLNLREAVVARFRSSGGLAQPRRSSAAREGDPRRESRELE